MSDLYERSAADVFAQRRNAVQRAVEERLIEVKYERLFAEAATNELKAKAVEAVRPWVSALNLPPAEAKYLIGIYARYLRGAKSYRIGENFIPSAQLGPRDRRQKLGVINYGYLKAADRREGYSDAAKNIRIVMNPSDGGLGEAVARKAYLNGRAMTEPEIADRERDDNGDIKLGAKGTDLAFDIILGDQITFGVSVAEIKLLRKIHEFDQFGTIVYQPLISDASKPSYEALLDKPYLLDKSKTYRQIM